MNKNFDDALVANIRRLNKVVSGKVPDDQFLTKLMEWNRLAGDVMLSFGIEEENFKEGDRVKVISGAYIGATGVVSANQSVFQNTTVVILDRSVGVYNAWNSDLELIPVKYETVSIRADEVKVNDVLLNTFGVGHDVVGIEKVGENITIETTVNYVTIPAFRLLHIRRVKQ